MASAAANPVSLRLGGPVFLKTSDYGELAREHRRLGYRAAYCPDADPGDSAKIKTIRDAFAKEDVVLAEVGAWVNMLDADPAKRKANLEYVTKRMALAEAAGARCCVDIAGSFARQWDGPDPRNYSREFLDATVENCRKVIDAVKPQRAKFAIEMMPWAIPDSPDSYLRLIKAVDRPAFGVHVDVCNMINSVDRYFHNAALIDETFRKLQKWIVSCHAKDVGPRSTHFAEVLPGHGGVDYAAYLRSLARYAPDAPLMIEHLSKPEEYDEAKKYILGVAKQTGVPFL